MKKMPLSHFWIGLILGIILISCGNNEISYPEEYCYDRVEVDNCLFVLLDPNGYTEIQLSNALEEAFALNVKTTLDEIIELPFSGLFQCIELLDENSAKLKAEFDGQTEEALVQYNLNTGTLTIDGAPFILEQKDNDLALLLQASILFPGADNAGNPNAFVANYSEASDTDLSKVLEDLIIEDNYLIGDTIGICLPQIIYKK